MSAEVRPYQEEGIVFLTDARRAILADDPGLGKTMQALLAARDIKVDASILIVAPKTAAGVWQDEARKWLGDDVGLYVGYGRKRADLDYDIVVTNYKLMDEVARHRREWDVLIFDEAHKLRNARRRNRGPGPFAAFRKLKARHALFHLTGTPFFKSAADVWPLFNSIDPKRFGAYWAFAKRWANVYQQVTPNGFVPVVEGVSDPEGFKAAFADVMLRRARDVLPAGMLPPLTRQRVPLTLTPKQARHYRELEKQLITMIDEETVLMTPTKLALLTRLRQLLVTPRILGIDDDGAIIEALRDGIETPAVIFTPFEEAIPYLAEALGGTPYTISHKTRHPGAIAAAFNTDDDPGRVLISTIQMGESWSAHTAANAYFAGFHWNPSTHEQAESRLHRPPQELPVMARYFTHRGTVDTHVMSILRKKVTMQSLLMAPVDLLEGVL